MQFYPLVGHKVGRIETSWWRAWSPRGPGTPPAQRSLPQTQSEAQQRQWQRARQTQLAGVWYRPASPVLRSAALPQAAGARARRNSPVLHGDRPGRQRLL